MGKVLFILPTLSGGGAERVVINMLVEMHKRGCLVCLVVFEHKGALVPILPDDLPVYNLDTISLRKSLFSLTYKIRCLKPKIIFSTFGYVNVALLAIRWLLPQGSNIWLREANLPSISLKNNSHSWLMHLGYRWLYPMANRVLCTSLKMQDEFLNIFKTPPSKISLLFNPVDEHLIRSKVEEGVRCNTDIVSFVASGRLTYQKGFDRLLYWFANLDNKNSRLTVLGEGYMDSELRLLADDLNISDRVDFLGFCDNPWQAYAMADVFLLSSRWEGMPNVALEALACGTPVIATSESGGIAEVAEQSVRGAVTVVDAESGFELMMRSVLPRSNFSKRDSLLPEKYQLHVVVDEFLKLVDTA